MINPFKRLAKKLEEVIHGRSVSNISDDMLMANYSKQDTSLSLNNLSVIVTNDGSKGKLLLQIREYQKGGGVLDSMYLQVEGEAKVKIDKYSSLNITYWAINEASLSSALRAIFGFNVPAKVVMRFIPVSYLLKLSTLQSINSRLSLVDGVTVHLLEQRNLYSRYCVQTSESILFSKFEELSKSYIEPEQLRTHPDDPGFLAFANVAGSDPVPKEMVNIQLGELR